MPKGRNAGYVFGIVDPTTKEIVFVGNSFQPWLSIHRHILGGAGNYELTKWLRQQIGGNPVEILSDVVIDKFEDNSIKLPAVKKEHVRIHWKVLAVEPVTETSSNTLKRAIIKELKERGQAYFNKTPGRPRGYTMQVLEVLRQEREARKQEETQRLMETLT